MLCVGAYYIKIRPRSLTEFHTVSWMSDQAETCGVEATAELQKWRQISNESSLKCVEEHDLASYLERQVEETRENVSAGSAREDNSEGES
jgi:hypothetical protein